MTMLALSFAFFIAPNLAFAEQSGWFVGIQGAYSKAQTERIFDSSGTVATRQTSSYRIWELDTKNQRTGDCANVALNTKCSYGSSTRTTKSGLSSTYYPSEDYTGYNAGLLAGYKHFFSPKFGLRLYTLFDASFFKNDESALQRKFQAYNYTLNLDLLYNLFVKDDFSLGVFGGVGAGGVRYVSSGNHFDDINLGLNLGLRVNLSHHHGFEFYSHINGNGFFQKQSKKDGITITANPTQSQSTREECERKSNPNSNIGCTSSLADKTKKTQKYTTYTTTINSTTTGGGIYTNSFSQPYQIGIRYIYSF